jgi:Amt family ammonium transporter
MDSGSIAWVLTATALVLFMVPGLALFYGGMVRSKSVLNMLLMNMVCLGIVPIVWVLVGYSLALQGEGNGGLIGTLDAVGLKDLGAEDLLLVAFLMTFAAITPALISGAVADRLKFSAWMVFVPLWSLLVYVPVVFWIYGPDGWLKERGSLDFAGGTAIHINAGVAALAVALVLGRRKGWPNEPMLPHNLPLVTIGAGILWFGWFGFNAGSALAANDVAIEAFLNTFLAAAAAMMGWLVAERIKDGHFTTLGAASGVVAGLVAITPAAGYVSGLSSLVFGAVAGVLCFLAVSLKYRFRYDDSLDVVGVHMVGGIVGGLLLGLFADEVLAGDDHGWLLGGGMDLFTEQIIAIVVVMIYSFVVTFIIAKAIDLVMGLRVDDDTEVTGLDRTEHAETAYQTL